MNGNAYIEIDNTKAVIEDCSSILTMQNELDIQINSLEGSMRKINEIWASNGNDKQSYVAELEKQIQNLRLMKSAIFQFANSIKSYAEAQEATSNATVR